MRNFTQLALQTRWPESDWAEAHARLFEQEPDDKRLRAIWQAAIAVSDVIRPRDAVEALLRAEKA